MKIDTYKSSITKITKALGMFPVLLLICVLFTLLNENFLSLNNFNNVFRAASINITLAAGMTLIILTGGIDLSVGSVLAVSAVVSLLVSLTPFAWAAVPAGLLVGMLIGLIHASLIAYIKLPPFIVTLGGLTMWRGVSFLLANGTTVINNDIAFEWIGNNSFLRIPWLGWIAICVVVIFLFVLRKTLLGVHIYAVGGNAQAARLTGISVPNIQMIVYGASGLLAGLTGVMLSSRLYSANGLLGQGYELDAIAAVILGGTSLVGGIGGIGGTLIGALIIAVLNNGLTIMQVSYYWQLVIKGVVIILAVIIDKVRRIGRN